jgi:hypothetical protein
MFYGTGPCVADRSIAALAMDKFVEDYTDDDPLEPILLQEDPSDEQPTQSKRGIQTIKTSQISS